MAVQDVGALYKAQQADRTDTRLRRVQSIRDALGGRSSQGLMPSPQAGLS
jgi:hypothetical protein